MKNFVVADATPKQSEMQSSGSVLPRFRIARLSVISFVLGWFFCATMTELMWMFSAIPLPTAPVAALEPFRIANRYGLFGIMTRGRSSSRALRMKKPGWYIRSVTNLRI
jgi:hypothetical protein